MEPMNASRFQFKARAAHRAASGVCLAGWTRSLYRSWEDPFCFPLCRVPRKPVSVLSKVLWLQNQNESAF